MTLGRGKRRDIVDSGHETDPSTGSDSESATFYPTPLRPQFLTGISKDLKRRLPYYLDDWRLPPPLTTIINASLSSFVRQLIPALIFASWMEQQTEGKLSAAEVLMSTGVVGIFYAIFSGQPLVLVGVSGPVALLLGASHGLATEFFQADFFAFFWWMCIWTSILHLFTACFGLVSLARLITPFTSQVFEFFVAISFIYKSINDMIHPFLSGYSASDDDHSKAYTSLVVGLLTFSICYKLHFVESSIYFTNHVRSFLANYNMLIATLVATGLSYIPDFSKSADNKDIIQRISHVASSTYDWTPSVDRNWLEITPLTGIDTKGIFGALIPGLMLYILFFMEHNMSSAIAQAPKYKLRKPTAYHWDFFTLGLSTIACGFLGLPPCCGVTPQAPLHTRALCTKLKDENGSEHLGRCSEQRWSALLQAGLMIAVLSVSSFISNVPAGCLFGVLLYLGVDAMRSNGIWTRITLKFIMPSQRPQIAIVTDVSSWDTVQRYTGVQLGLSLAAFGTVYFTEHGYIFPLILAIGIPIRKLVVGCIFMEEDLEHLDPAEMTEKEIVEEHRELKQCLSPSSAAGSDVFQRVHEFHHSSLVYDADSVFTKDAPEQVQAANSPRRGQSPRRKRSTLEADVEFGLQSPARSSMVQSLSKVPRSNNNSAPAPTFLSSWNAWTTMFDTETTPGESWCGTGVGGVDEVMKQPVVYSDRDELSVRKIRSSRSVKSSRSVRTEVHDADDTVRSMRSDHTRNKSRTMRIMTPSANELFDSDLMSLRSKNSSGDQLVGENIVHERSPKPKVRGLANILGTERKDKPISPRSLRSSSSWRSNRSIRKYSDVERARSNELDFDADRVLIPESILKKPASRRGREAAGRIAFAQDAQSVEYDFGGSVRRQYSEQEEM
ncbi:MAG: hypothetical protein SGBAC_004406 [Bacillariaceae sp.]